MYIMSFTINEYGRDGKPSALRRYLDSDAYRRSEDYTFLWQALLMADELDGNILGASLKEGRPDDPELKILPGYLRTTEQVEADEAARERAEEEFRAAEARGESYGYTDSV